MKCPVCTDVRMREVERDGVLIDICPDCKGVWLDRGELDKLVKGVREVRDEYDRLERSINMNPNYPSGDPYRDRSRDQGYNTGKGYSQHGQQGQHGQHGQQGYDSHGYGQHGKHGKPHKKKTMLDVFGDLFE